MTLSVACAVMLSPAFAMLLFKWLIALREELENEMRDMFGRRG